MFHFDYCENCSHLFKLLKEKCPNCDIDRFKVNSNDKPIEKRMKNFFLCASLKNIQQSYYGGMLIFKLLLIFLILCVLKVLSKQ
jgi:hypothetical protein